MIKKIDSSHVLVVGGQITHNLRAFHLALESASCAAEASWARFACNANPLWESFDQV